MGKIVAVLAFLSQSPHQRYSMTRIVVVLAFPFLLLICAVPQDAQDCRPEELGLPTTDISAFGSEETCPRVNGHNCYSNVEWTDSEDAFARTSDAGQSGKVRLVGKQLFCWERQGSQSEDGSTGGRDYFDCMDSMEEDCDHKDKVEICFRDDIDAAQAMCRHFRKGDAYSSKAYTAPVTSGRKKGRILKRRQRDGRRTELAYLKCNAHPNDLNDCTLEYLPKKDKQCEQMEALCYFSSCWQAKNTMRARTSSTKKTYRYGQMCKYDINEANARHCARGCFNCPQEAQANGVNRWDGETCFKTLGNTHEAVLFWEPHFRTLDGKHFDFQGQCSYYLMKHGDFSVVAKFSVCGKKNVTCTSEITATTGNTVIRLGQNNDFSITYRRRRITPTKPFHNDDINYYLASSEYDALDLWDGFKILWDRKAEYRVVIPPWNNVQMEGLLGNLDGDKENDMMTPNRKSENDPVKFGDSWLVPGSCPPGVSPHAPQNPTLTRSEKESADRDGCKYIWHHFQNCSSNEARVEKVAQYNNCLMDVATCDLGKRDLNTCLCPSLEFLASYCQKKGEGVGDWRAKMPEPLCKPKCDWEKKREVFRLDADPCSQTCDAIKYIKEKKFECVKMEIEGCNCKEGEARNADGVCIAIDKCPQ